MKLPVVNAAIVASNPNVRQVANANTDFGFNLLHKLTANQPTGNVFFSRFSISNALDMTLNGAGGQTRNDMAQALGLGAMDLDQINQGNSLLLKSATHPDAKVQITVANALWASSHIPLAPNFVQLCARYYNATATTLDFASPASVDAINGWVDKNTHGKIMRLVSQPDIAKATAVLTNAVYFHGKWQYKFDKTRTHDGAFTLAGGSVKNVPLMSQNGRFSYLETPQFQAASLPYGAGRMSLYVFLPKKGISLSAFVEQLNAANADKWIGEMKPTQMTIILPRFRADYQTELKTPLSALGMGLAFDRSADFSPMGLPPQTYISNVIHKAVLEVDEKGTVAAAATGTIIETLSIILPQTVMRVDHPFYMAIRDNSTGTILFEGVIRDPK